jgi:hypothetical protein
MPTARRSTKKSWLGILVIAGGLALLIVAPQAQSCVTDYDSTACETAGIIAFNIAGLVGITIGGVLAVFGLEPLRDRRLTHQGPDPAVAGGEEPPTS